MSGTSINITVSAVDSRQAERELQDVLKSMGYVREHESAQHQLHQLRQALYAVGATQGDVIQAAQDCAVDPEFPRPRRWLTEEEAVEYQALKEQAKAPAFIVREGLEDIALDALQAAMPGEVIRVPSERARLYGAKTILERMAHTAMTRDQALACEDAAAHIGNVLEQIGQADAPKTTATPITDAIVTGAYANGESIQDALHRALQEPEADASGQADRSLWDLLAEARDRLLAYVNSPTDNQGLHDAASKAAGHIRITLAEHRHAERQRAKIAGVQAQDFIQGRQWTSNQVNRFKARADGDGYQTGN